MPRPPRASFRHDADAHNCPRELRLRERCGWSGYGLLWALLERLRVVEEHRFEVRTVPSLAMALGVGTDELTIVISTCCETGLLDTDGTYFWSPPITRDLELEEHLSAVRREAALRGANARWGREVAT